MRLPLQVPSIQRGRARLKPAARVSPSSQWSCIAGCVASQYTVPGGLSGCATTNASAWISCIVNKWQAKESLSESVMFRGIAQCALECIAHQWPPQ